MDELRELDHRLEHMRQIELFATYLLQNKDKIDTISYQIKGNVIQGETAEYNYIGSYYSAVGLTTLGLERIKDIEYASELENEEENC